MNASKRSELFSVYEAADLLPLEVGTVCVSFCAVMQAEILRSYSNLAVNCHASIMVIRLQYSHSTSYLALSVECASQQRILLLHMRENMRRVSTRRWWYQKYIDHVWHFMRLSVFRSHFAIVIRFIIN